MKQRSFLKPIVGIAAAALLLAMVGCSTPESVETEEPAVACPEGNPYDLVVDCTLTVLTRDTLPPCTMIVEQERVGFCIDLLDTIAANLGLGTEYTAIGDPSALLQQVGVGRYDVGGLTLSATDERREVADFTEVFYWGFGALLVTAENPYESIDELIEEGLSIGVATGTVQETYIKENYPELDVKVFNNQPAGRAGLLGNQVDAIYAGGPDAMIAVAENDDLVITQQISNDQGSSMPIARGNDALRDAIDEQLQILIEDGTWFEIYTKWYGDLAVQPEFEDLYPGVIPAS